MQKSNGKGRGKGRGRGRGQGRGRGRGETVLNNNYEDPVQPGRVQHGEPSKPVKPVEEKRQAQAIPEARPTKPAQQPVISEQKSTSSIVSSPKKAENASMFGAD